MKKIKLSQNENPFGPSPLALKAIKDNFDLIYRYPEYTPKALISKLAQKHNVLPENVAISAGSVELIDLMIKSFVGKDENIVTGKTTFAAYFLISAIHGRECKGADLVDYTFDVDNLLSLCNDKTKVIFIANPNNPTGTVISHETLNKLMQKLPPNILVVNDEAYAEYVTDTSYPESFSLLEKFPNLIISRTFSKIFGLAGLRVGYAIARSDIAQSLAKSRTPFSVNRLAATAAFAALDDSEYVQKCASINDKERIFLYEEMKSMGFNVVPTQANFIFVEFNSIEEKVQISNLLEKAGIFVRDMTPFGAEKGLRISVGLPEDNQYLIKVLKQNRL